MAFHKDLVGYDIHIIYAFEYADSVARLAASGFVANDVGKLARQLDNNTFWVLTATTPTWAPVASFAAVDWGAISGTLSNQTDLQNALDGKADDPHTHTESEITDLDHTDSNAIHKNVSAEISSISVKATPHADDIILLEDSESSFAKKKMSLSTIPLAHTHSNKAQLDLVTDGDHDVRTDNPHGVTPAQIGASPTGHGHTESDISDLDKYTQLEVDNLLAAQDVSGDVIIENGFVQPGSLSETTLSYNEGTREITIAPSGVDYSFWSYGTKFTKSSPITVQHSDVTGLHLYYFDNSGNPQIQTTVTSDLIFEKCFFAVVYWNATTSTGVIVGDERHGRQMDAATHDWAHRTFGTLWSLGLGVTDIDTDQNGSLPAHAQIGIADGAIRDEDIVFNIADGSPQDIRPAAAAPFLWRSAVDTWSLTAANGYLVLTAGTGRAAYNNLTTNTLDEVPNGDFVLSHIISTNDIRYPIMIVPGQSAYSNINDARVGAENEINLLSLSGLEGIVNEWKALFTVIVETKNTFTNAVKSTTRTTLDGDEFVDWRPTNQGGGGSSGDWAPIIHTHLETDITDLDKYTQSQVDTLLSGKSNIGHTHTESEITDLDHTDANAIHDNVAAEINAIAVKATPVGADIVLIEDSAAGFAKKKVAMSTIIPSNIIIDPTNNDIFFMDSVRSQYVGAAILQVTAGRRNDNVTDQYLRIESETNLNGFVLPYNATLVGISMSEELNTQTWTAQIRKNGSATVLSSLTITNQYNNQDFTKDVDFSAGDRVQIYLSGTDINHPLVTAFFRRRQ